MPLDNLPQRSAEGWTGHGYTAIMLVPTGIGASIGGFAGDALPTARAIASVVDTLITHPNVMNGASLYWPMSNALYTEGYALDQFAEGAWGLLPVRTGGVMGDGRTYDHVCALRAVTSVDGMTADSYPFEHAFLSRVATRIINEVKGINRVVYDLTSKPPGTIEWE